MASLVDLLTQERTLVTDGATGTNLQTFGLAMGQAPEEWVMSNPDKVRDLHRSFVDAGSDIILTCSFGGNAIRIKSSSVADQMQKVNQRAAELAREAIESSANVVVLGGSIGPTGEMVEPYGMLSEDDAREAFRLQAAALVEGGVEFIALETFFAIEEAKAALNGVRDVTDVPVTMTFSYDRGVRTMMGVKPAGMYEAFRDAGLTAIGANCGTTLENMELIVKELAALEAPIPIWAKPNAGVPEGVPPFYPVNPDEMGAFALRLVEAGARFVGGCCGSTPEHVAAIAKAVK